MIGFLPQLMFSFIMLLPMPMIGLSIYTWILCVAPLVGFYKMNTNDTRTTRLNLAKLYCCCSVLSYLWAMVGPFIMGDFFWGNHCHVKIKVSDGSKEHLHDFNICTEWHFKAFMILTVRLAG
jgi:hypothetical protein